MYGDVGVSGRGGGWKGKRGKEREGGKERERERGDRERGTEK